MRFSRIIVHGARTLAIMIALCALSSQIVVSAPAESGWQVTVERTQPRGELAANIVGPFRMRLGFADERAALQALQFALNEVGDGSTFVWHRKAGALTGTVRPTAAFINDRKRLCRHLVFSLSVGNRTSSIEGIACRTEEGYWQL